MALFDFIKKKKVQTAEEDFEKELYSILEFLATVGRDIKDLYEAGVKVRALRIKERSEVDSKKQLKLLSDEIFSWDAFLERFVMFQRDVTVSGERAKKISSILKDEARVLQVPYKVQKLLKEKDEWNFDW